MTKTAKTLSLLRRMWLSPLESAKRGGCLALSQRVGEFKRSGIRVIDRWVDTKGGARIKQYRVARG